MCFCGALRAWRAVAPLLSCLLWHWTQRQLVLARQRLKGDKRGFKDSRNISEINQNFYLSEVQWVSKGKFKKSKGEVLFMFWGFYANGQSFLFQCSALWLTRLLSELGRDLTPDLRVLLCAVEFPGVCHSWAQTFPLQAVHKQGKTHPSLLLDPTSL